MLPHFGARTRALANDECLDGKDADENGEVQGLEHSVKSALH